jgi:hypothetical protein
VGQGGSQFEGAENDLSIVVPTINSSDYIDIVLGFYRQHQIPVTVFVDDRSSDGTYALIQRLGPDIRLIRNPGNVVEDLLPLIAEMCPTRWILRIDDDELPTLAMMQFVQEVIRCGEIAVYGFPRHQCAISPGAGLLSATQYSPTLHGQWRLFQPAQVTFQNSLHSSGLSYDGKRQAAPEPASLIHLDWAFHSYAERLRKVEFYDAHTPGGGTRWRPFYLYEEADLAEQRFAELALPEFARPRAEIAQRFPDLCVGVKGGDVDETST